MADLKEVLNTTNADAIVVALKEIQDRGGSESELFIVHGYELKRVCKPVVKELKIVKSELLVKEPIDISYEYVDPANVKIVYNIKKVEIEKEPVVI